MGTEFNLEALEQEFNLNPEEKITQEIQTMRDRLHNINDDVTVDQFIRINIDRANSLLDLAENRLQVDFSARTLEACGKLIAEVTTAVNALSTVEFQNQTFGLRERTLDLKELEIQIKADKNKDVNVLPEASQVTQNILCTSREDLLSLMKDQTKQPEFIDVVHGELENN